MHIFVWSKIKDTKYVGPVGMVQIAQSFKYVGTIIPRYTIIKYHFIKKYILKIIGSTVMYNLPEYPLLQRRVITLTLALPVVMACTIERDTNF